MLAALLSPLARFFARKPTKPRWIDVAGLRAQIAHPEMPLVIDVRGVDEFHGPLGHIEGARNIPLPELAAHQAEIAAAVRPVVCVCLTDKRSAAAAAQLTTWGVSDVCVLRGGMKAWREAGL